jgi:hypothetical protein
LLQSLAQQCLLALIAAFCMTKIVFADVPVRGGQVRAIEGALACALQTDEDGHLWRMLRHA